MNAAALLALIGDMYAQVAQLTDENKQLRAALAQTQPVEENQ
jgi:hypothetical protein